MQCIPVMLEVDDLGICLNSSADMLFANSSQPHSPNVKTKQLCRCGPEWDAMSPMKAHLCYRHGVGCKDPCKTNIGNFGCAVHCQQNVGGFEIQMHDTVAVQEMQAFCYIQCNASPPALHHTSIITALQQHLGSGKCCQIGCYVRV